MRGGAISRTSLSTASQASGYLAVFEPEMILEEVKLRGIFFTDGLTQEVFSHVSSVVEALKSATFFFGVLTK